MQILRRLVAVVVLLLSIGAIIGCIAGIVGVWILHREVSERAQRIALKLDVGVQRVAAANQNVQLALEKARADVANVGKESADLGSGGAKSRLAARSIRSLIQKKAGPDMDDLGGRLATLSDSAIAVSSLLDSFQEVSLTRATQIDPDQLTRRADEARQVSSILRRLEGVVGDGNTETSRQEVTAATDEVDRFLQQCQVTIDAWQLNLDSTHGTLAQIKPQFLGWLTWATIGVTVLCAWMAAGQISLFAHALRWCRATGG